jgi:TfoX/Sxy family transcriptional regulator of competence genes
MATSQDTIDFILDQLSSLPRAAARKMFGEYALYVGDSVAALVCDDTLFVKITPEGKDFVGVRYQEGFAYPGAKASMQIESEYLEDREWLVELLSITAEHLPPPKPKKKKKPHTISTKKTTSKSKKK